MPPLEIPQGTEASSMANPTVACAARDEAAALRHEICQLRVRINELEDERAFVSAKSSELEETLRSFKKDEVHENLVKKSLQVAEMTTAMEAFSEKIKKMSEYEVKLKCVIVKERRQSKAKLEELTAVVKSLQHVNSSDDDSTESGEEVPKILTPEQALDMTMKNLKFHIEFLEDERQTMAVECSGQKKKIDQLEKDVEMKNVKIEMLEELFRQLNDQRHVDESSDQEEPLADQKSTERRGNMAKSNSAPDLIEGAPKRRARRGGPMKDPEAVESRRQRRAMRNSRSSGKGFNIVVDGKEGTYAGPMKDGLPNGVGTVRFESGETYLGEVKDGKLHGLGALYSKSGVTRGRFENNELVTKK